MNVYQMYKENGNKVGFWIRRRSWGNTIAKVIKVNGSLEGKLEGRDPYYKNPPVIVNMYDLRSGDLVKDARALFEGIDSFDMPLSCPGTYSYHMLEKDIVRRHFATLKELESGNEKDN